MANDSVIMMPVFSVAFKVANNGPFRCDRDRRGNPAQGGYRIFFIDQLLVGQFSSLAYPQNSRRTRMCVLGERFRQAVGQRLKQSRVVVCRFKRLDPIGYRIHRPQQTDGILDADFFGCNIVGRDTIGLTRGF